MLGGSAVGSGTLERNITIIATLLGICQRSSVATDHRRHGNDHVVEIARLRHEAWPDDTLLFGKHATKLDAIVRYLEEAAARQAGLGLRLPKCASPNPPAISASGRGGCGVCLTACHARRLARGMHQGVGSPGASAWRQRNSAWSCARHGRPCVAETSSGSSLVVLACAWGSRFWSKCELPHSQVAQTLMTRRVARWCCPEGRSRGQLWPETHGGLGAGSMEGDGVRRGTRPSQSRSGDGPDTLGAWRSARQGVGRYMASLAESLDFCCTVAVGICERDGARAI